MSCTNESPFRYNLHKIWVQKRQQLPTAKTANCMYVASSSIYTNIFFMLYVDKPFTYTSAMLSKLHIKCINESIVDPIFCHVEKSTYILVMQFQKKTTTYVLEKQLSK